MMLTDAGIKRSEHLFRALFHKSE
ncbi:hypothetical protein [Sphingobium cloacae]